MRIDLHCHTKYSPDSLTTIDSLLRWMDRRELDMVAITDHNTIAGALDFHSRAPDRFLVGEEIKTTRGELLALFIGEEVPPGLSIQETMARVRAQGGLVGVSHPLDRVRSDAVGRDVLDEIHAQLDFVEVLNARTTFRGDNQQARELAAGWGLPGSAGSDAHASCEVGKAYVELASFDGPAAFLEGLAQGQVRGGLSNPLVHLFSRYATWRRRLGAE